MTTNQTVVFFKPLLGDRQLFRRPTKTKPNIAISPSGALSFSSTGGPAVLELLVRANATTTLQLSVDGTLFTVSTTPNAYSRLTLAISLSPTSQFELRAAPTTTTIVSDVAIAIIY